MTPSPSDWLERLHLWLVAPATIALVFLIGPLEASDEPMHMMRADAISHGTIIPMLIDAPGAVHGAGGVVDVALRDWIVALEPVPNSEIVPRSRSAVLDTASMVDRGLQQGEIHSNTAIYPPLLYLQSAASTLIARAVGAPVVVWFYAARLANVLTAVTIFVALMRSMREFRPFILVASALPIMLYQTATLSADAVLLPVSVAFACLLARLSTTPQRRRGLTICLGIATMILCVGKVAYLPLAMFPPLVARVADRHWSRRATLLAAVSLLSLILWLMWAWFVHDKVFTIRPDIPVSPVDQLKWMLGHPLAALDVFAGTLVKNAPFIGYTAIGSHLGGLNFRISHAVVIVAMLATFATLSSTRIVPEPPRWLSGSILAACGGIALIVVLLLYLQFNAVGNPTIEGIQGRYFLPVAFLAILFVPKPRRVWPLALTHGVPAAFAVMSCVYMLFTVSRTYWVA